MSLLNKNDILGAVWMDTLRRGGDLEAKVYAKATFVTSALLGFGVGMADRIISGGYNPGAAAVATAFLTAPFLIWGGGAERIARYVLANAGLNAGYSAGYATVDAIETLFSMPGR
ncbi:TPA: hypothetical protein HA231_03085 [Candidatus Woesearchaeota archaeon]|nr:hypothetical protein [Candidatus Woesearchaeota archaeon]